MSFKIIPLPIFLKELKSLSKKYPSLKNDLKNLESTLSINPKLGISLGRNCYKIRLAITSKGKGKSGGARIITHLLVTVTNKTLYLLKIYDKADQETVSDTELKSLLDLIKIQ